MTNPPSTLQPLLYKYWTSSLLLFDIGLYCLTRVGVVCCLWGNINHPRLPVTLSKHSGPPLNACWALMFMKCQLIQHSPGLDTAFFVFLSVSPFFSRPLFLFSPAITLTLFSFCFSYLLFFSPLLTKSCISLSFSLLICYPSFAIFPFFPPRSSTYSYPGHWVSQVFFALSFCVLFYLLFCFYVVGCGRVEWCG